MKIHYTIANSRLGRLLFAATHKGVSALYLGKSDAELEQALRNEYPRAGISREPNAYPNMREWLNQVLDHLKGHEPHLNLPIDVQATAFQRRVWEELRKIPYGSTLTYTEVARSMGKPDAVRDRKTILGSTNVCQ